MKTQRKNSFLSKENYIILITSIKTDLETSFDHNTSCTCNTGVHKCLTKNYCQFLGNKLLDFIKPHQEFKTASDDVFRDLLCGRCSDNVSYNICSSLYTSYNLSVIAINNKIYLSELTYPVYAFFMKFCVILEQKFLNDYNLKKAIIEYLLYFFRKEGKIGRREKKAIKKLQKDIKSINKGFSKEESIFEIRAIVQRASYHSANGKEKPEYFRFLDFMRELLSWYINEKDSLISDEFLSILLGDSISSKNNY